MKKAFISLGLILAAILVVAVIRTSSKVQSEVKDVPLRGRLQWFAKEAKNADRKKVTIPSPRIEYAGESTNIDLDEALSSSNLVIAQLVEKRTFSQNDNNLVTWNKFRIEEVLSEPRNLPCPGCVDSEPPSEMLPIQSKEFLLSTSGGRVMIDGVEVEQIESGFPEFQPDTKYLLFLYLSPKGVAGTLGGSVGVFRIDEKGDALPVSESAHRIRRDFKERFANSPARLRNSLTSSRP